MQITAGRCDAAQLQGADSRRWQAVATVTDSRIREVSGLVASRTQPGVLWMHNDSGDRARVFAVDARTGSTLGEVRVDGARALDWEDLAYGPGPDAVRGARPWLYVGDIGDNLGWRPWVNVYRFEEPAPVDGEAHAERIRLTYPDGRRDAEAMFVDPVDGSLYIVGKHAETGVAELYSATAAAIADGDAQLQRIATLAIGPRATGASISASGDAIAVTTYEGVYSWRRGSGERVVDAVTRPPHRTRGTGAETIAFSPDGGTWFAIPEGQRPPIRTTPVRLGA